MTKMSKDKAQAITELAVFGSILIFVIGGIIHNAALAGMNQNQSLKAMRWTLLQSLYGVYDQNKSRDFATMLLIEDRLDPSPEKYGSLERMPLIASGSGTMSNTLFMPLDWWELHNVPVTDVFVNGQHFTFSIARFILYDIQLVTSDTVAELAQSQDPEARAAIPETAQHIGDVRVWDLANNIRTYIKKDGNWDDNCRYREHATDFETCTPNDVDNNEGCPIFYRVVPSNSKHYCNNPACLNGLLSLEQRFDLNRNSDYADDLQPGEQRDNAVWQWGGARALTGSARMKIDAKNGIYLSYDVDGDRKEEIVYNINGKNKCGGLDKPERWKVDLSCRVARNGQPARRPNGLTIKRPGIAQRVAVLDSQKGDLDQSIDDLDKNGPNAADFRSVGLESEASIYSMTKDGTYLEIKEGKAYVPGTTDFVRSVNKKDQFDLISRVFQLSNDTGRFCDYSTPNSPVPWPTIGNFKNGLVNPVKYCVDSANPDSSCYTSTTMSQTCYDRKTKKMFIRSRIEDKRGRKWFTQTK